MDFSIWLPPENQDESTNPTNSWEYYQYFDPRLDVIEEEALNERSCKEVLTIWNNQADLEVIELEDDILPVQNRLTCEDYMDVAALNEKNVNLESMLRPSHNENQQLVEPGIGSSNLPEGLNKTVEFRDYCTVQANNTVLASLVEVENQQETPAGTTLEDDRHASEQDINKNSSKSTQNEVKSVQINDTSGVKGQEVLHTEIDRTMEDTQPHPPNYMRNDRSTSDNYEDKTIKGTRQRAGTKRTGDSADITATPQRNLRKRSKTGFAVPVVKEKNNQSNVQNVLVSSPGRTSQEPQILSSVNDVDIDLSNSSTTPVPHVASASSSLAYIYHKSLVQLKSLAHQHNIHGVSKTRKADLQQILRAKLQT